MFDYWWSWTLFICISFLVISLFVFFIHFFLLECPFLLFPTAITVFFYFAGKHSWIGGRFSFYRLPRMFIKHGSISNQDKNTVILLEIYLTGPYFCAFSLPRIIPTVCFSSGLFLVMTYRTGAWYTYVYSDFVIMIYLERFFLCLKITFSSYTHITCFLHCSPIYGILRHMV